MGLAVVCGQWGHAGAEMDTENNTDQFQNARWNLFMVAPFALQLINSLSNPAPDSIKLCLLIQEEGTIRFLTCSAYPVIW